jgi:hypothetical protein
MAVQSRHIREISHVFFPRARQLWKRNYTTVARTCIKRLISYVDVVGNAICTVRTRKLGYRGHGAKAGNREAGHYVRNRTLFENMDFPRFILVRLPTLLLHTYNAEVWISWVCCLIQLVEHVWLRVNVLILLYVMEVWWRCHAVSITITYIQCRSLNIMGVLFNTIAWICVTASECTNTITCNGSLMEVSCSQYYYYIHTTQKFQHHECDV